MQTHLLRYTAALAAATLISACDTDAGDAIDSLAMRDTTAIDTGATQVSTGAMADRWNDAQIFGVLAMVNGGRMAAAELAKARATNPEVKALADSIDQTHVAMQRVLSQLARRLNVAPATPDDSSVIKEQNEDMAELQRENAGREWDQEFVDELEDWQEDTREVLTRAIESTHTPELRQALLDMRTRLEQNLKRTAELEDRLG